MSTIQHIYKWLEILPANLQTEVLHFVEFLVLKNKKNKEIQDTVRTREFHFIGKGDSRGAINQIDNLRDFAYEE
ncbi:MAG: DUF2281 domain-containing protein [Bacteroidia bacterium]